MAIRHIQYIYIIPQINNLSIPFLKKIYFGTKFFFKNRYQQKDNLLTRKNECYIIP